MAQRERPIVVVAGDLRQLDLFEHLGEPPTRRVIDARRFGALVREARRTKGLTLRQAARLTDLSRSALGNIETATYPPGPMVAARLIARLVEEVIVSVGRPIENPQLRIVADWLDRASRWLEGEVRDNRQDDLAEGVSDPEQLVEILTFIRPELDRMVTGLRRAAGMLVAMTMPPKTSSAMITDPPTNSASRSRAHLRLVK